MNHTTHERRIALSVSLMIELPDDALSILRTDPESFSLEMCLAAAMKWYELGMLSQGKAADASSRAFCS